MLTQNFGVNSSNLKDTFEGLLALRDYQIKTSEDITKLEKSQAITNLATSMATQLATANSMLNALADTDDPAMKNRYRMLFDLCMKEFDDNKKLVQAAQQPTKKSKSKKVP